ncbi:MAG TPA: hypothetical protein VJ938_08620 [Acidimicrobiia bacterium]|nr:hypothetical protein [Acidimicrobiia bacterium]
MTGSKSGGERRPSREGAWTGVDGSGYPVDVSGDRRWRSLLALLVGGQVVWISHFWLVYLVAEAACTGDGMGLDVFEPPVLGVVTLVATAVAVAACAAIGYLAHRSWRDPGDTISEAPIRRPLAFAGMLLAGLGSLAVLFVGLSVLVFPTC